MEVWWTATPDLPVVALGLFRTKDEAKEFIAREQLGQQKYTPVPIVIDGATAPDGGGGVLADQLAELGVAPDVLARFDGSVRACRRLATALLNVGTGDRAEAERDDGGGADDEGDGGA